MVTMTIADAAALLGVTEDATRADIDAAFKRLARLSHPDRFAGASAARSAAAAAEFIRITEARDVLVGATTGPKRRLAGAVSFDRPIDRPKPTVDPRRSIGFWTYVLIVVSVFCFLGGVLPFSPWNLALLLPLDGCVIVFGLTGRRVFLVGAIVAVAANAVVALAIVSIGSLVALEVLLVPVIALIVLGRRRWTTTSSSMRPRRPSS
jgi:hypothetical protein